MYVYPLTHMIPYTYADIHRKISTYVLISLLPLYHVFYLKLRFDSPAIDNN